ncbi:MAG: ATP-binding cassette domain-containing protein, partial [Lacisediminihabitans sp.]
LMDEPFGAVDPLVRAELQTELLRLQNELDKTVVFVTHDIDEAFLLGDHVVIFQKGGIIAQQGRPAEILAHPVSEFVASFIGADRGKRRLTISDTPPARDGDLVLVDGSGHPAGVLSTGVLSAQGGLLPAGTGPKSRSISNKTDQAGDA